MSSSDRTISSAFIRSYSNSTDQFKWLKEENWHVIAKIYDENHTVPARRKKASPVPASSSSSRRKKRHQKTTNNPIFSAESGRFSNEEVGDERSETLEDKRSKLRKSKNRSKHSTQWIEIINRQSSVEIGSPARLSIFKKLIPCSVDGKVKESFAIVKKSEDPYEDFKTSMVEMILENQIFEEEDLEQLLQCFLSLNSRQCHNLIFKAFSEISEAMFYGSSRNSIHHQQSVSSSS